MNYSAQQLVYNSRKNEFAIGPYKVLSQQPYAITEEDRHMSATNYLPAFIAIQHDIEQVTGYRWRNTSYIRISPNHQTGHAFDLAPEFDSESLPHYAVSRGSDPVLYLRPALYRALSRLKFKRYGPFTIGIFIESDHLHLQILKYTPPFGVQVVKWGAVKPLYADSIKRSKQNYFNQ